MPFALFGLVWGLACFFAAQRNQRNEERVRRHVQELSRRLGRKLEFRIIR